MGSTRCHSLNQFLPHLLQGKGSAVTPSVSRLQDTRIICPKGTVGMPTATAGSSHIPWTPGHNQGFQAGTTAPWSWFAWQLPQEQPDRVVTLTGLCCSIWLHPGRSQRRPRNPENEELQPQRSQNHQMVWVR